jgi:hypothetical protein
MFSNDMWHATCTHVDQGDFLLLTFISQIDTLTIGLLSAITCVLNIQMDNANPF